MPHRSAFKSTETCINPNEWVRNKKYIPFVYFFSFLEDNKGKYRSIFKENCTKKHFAIYTNNELLSLKNLASFMIEYSES